MESTQHLDIARLFADMARDFAAQPDQQRTCERIVAATTTVLACDAADVVRTPDSGGLRGTSESVLARSMMRIGMDTQAGVVDACLAQGVFVCADVPSDTRWPGWGEQVLEETPVRSAAACPLRVDETELGALAMYSTVEGFFTPAVADAAAIIADHAAIALASASASDRVDNLEIALASNRVIGMALGVLMTTNSLTESDAFDRMRATSQRTHRKLRDVAEYVVSRGELPAENGDTDAA